MKKILVSFMVAALLLLIASTAAFAAGPTTTTISWTGSGGVSGGVNSGDADGGFATSGSAISGTFTAVDSNDNPYGYSVDSFSTLFNGTVTNGSMESGVNRLTSKTSMYGPAGQASYSYVGTDGFASMAYCSTTNYAAMVDATYGYQLPGGHNIVVTGASSYLINRYILDGQGNSGQLIASGDGSAMLDAMSAEARGSGTLKFGQGAGCYTDASFNAVGTAGSMTVTGIGNSNVSFTGLGFSSGGGTLQLVADWVNNVSISDFSLTAH